MPPRHPVYFSPEEIIDACEKAKAGGGIHPLAKVFSIDETARVGPVNTNTKYLGVYCTIPGAQKHGRLVVRFFKEKHVGRIAPLDDAIVARINAESGGKYGMLKARDRDPTINIQKYPVYVPTDDQGAPIGKLPDIHSEYYALIALVDEFFYTEMQARLSDGRIALRDRNVTTYPKNAIIVPNAKIVPMMQTTATSSAGQVVTLANPICRMNLKFDKETALPKNEVRILDYTKSYWPEEGKVAFEDLTFDGKPVTAHNVHMIEPRSIVSGIVNLDAVCSSTMGLSIPTQIELLVVEPPKTENVTVEDVFGDMPFFGAPSPPNAAGGVNGSGGPPPPNAAGAPENGPPPPSAVAEDDLAGILNDLKVDGQ